MRLLLNFVVILAGLLALGWWFVFGDTMAPRTLHCRRTVVVDTPEGKRSGSNVVGITIRFPGGLTRAEGYAIIAAVQGDATVVDLGTRGILVATLTDEQRLQNGDHANNAGCESPFPRAAFQGNQSSTGDEFAAYLDELNKRKPKGDVPLQYLPMFIRFRDIHDPASVERVDPIDLSASFGVGVKFERMTVEITDAPLTDSIESQLPWLKSRKSERLSSQPLSRLHHSAIDLLDSNDLRSVPQ